MLTAITTFLAKRWLLKLGFTVLVTPTLLNIKTIKKVVDVSTPNLAHQEIFERFSTYVTQYFFAVSAGIYVTIHNTWGKWWSWLFNEKHDVIHVEALNTGNLGHQLPLFFHQLMKPMLEHKRALELKLLELDEKRQELQNVENLLTQRSEQVQQEELALELKRSELFNMEQRLIADHQKVQEDEVIVHKFQESILNGDHPAFVELKQALTSSTEEIQRLTGEKSSLEIELQACQELLTSLQQSVQTSAEQQTHVNSFLYDNFEKLLGTLKTCVFEGAVQYEIPISTIKQQIKDFFCAVQQSENPIVAETLESLGLPETSIVVILDLIDNDQHEDSARKGLSSISEGEELSATGLRGIEQFETAKDEAEFPLPASVKAPSTIGDIAESVGRVSSGGDTGSSGTEVSGPVKSSKSTEND